jgi:hypothetical protein
MPFINKAAAIKYVITQREAGKTVEEISKDKIFLCYWNIKSIGRNGNQKLKPSIKDIVNLCGTRTDYLNKEWLKRFDKLGKKYTKKSLGQEKNWPEITNAIHILAKNGIIDRNKMINDIRNNLLNERKNI